MYADETCVRDGLMVGKRCRVMPYSGSCFCSIRKEVFFKKIIINYLVVIITVCMLFLLAEGVTRLVMPDSVKLRLMHQPDEKLGYTLVPNYTMTHQTSEFSVSIKINSEGLRDHEYQIL
jgi:hypothetical protein